MKTILIKFDNSFFVRNFLRTDALSIMLARPDVRLVLLAPVEKIGYYQKEFLHLASLRPRIGANLLFEPLPQYRYVRMERIFKFIEMAGIHTRTATLIHRTEFVRTRGQKWLLRRFARYAAQRFCWHLGRFTAFRRFIRWVYYVLPSDAFSDIFSRYRPDLVYCSSLLPGDARLLKEAKRGGIRTAGMILSWDNLYSKTFLRVYPDTLLAHTSRVADQALMYGDYPAEQITLIGIPQYDRYMRKSDVVPRKEFIRWLGGDPNKRLIVYAVSGKAGLHIDLEIVEAIHYAIEKKEITYPAQVLFRPYPRYDATEEQIKRLQNRYGMLVKPSMAHVGKGKDSWEFDEQSLWLLSNTLAHADVVIVMYSTFFIEAAIFDKPLIAAAFDKEPRSYWHSARRFFEWDHLRELGEFGGITYARSREELINAINLSFENPSHLHEGRRRMVETQCQYTDGKSAERLANELLKLL